MNLLWRYGALDWEILGDLPPTDGAIAHQSNRHTSMQFARDGTSGEVTARQSEASGVWYLLTGLPLPCAASCRHRGADR